MKRITRNKTRLVEVGKVKIGNYNPVVIQSMTNTLTSDLSKTLTQIKALAQRGCQLVRVAVPDELSATKLASLVHQSPIPIIADIHFNHLLAIKAIEQKVHKIRINPGNLGSTYKIDEILNALKDNPIPMRIGINSGSLESELQTLYHQHPAQALFLSAAKWSDYFLERDFNNFVVSIKSSSVLSTIEANREYSHRYRQPIHLGITESGTVQSGSIFSSVGLGILLYEGIGDTIRVSLSGDPVNEIYVAQKILQSLEINPKPLGRLIACPTCSRCEYDVCNIAKRIEQKMLEQNVNLTIAVMGCIVNGPGEAKDADVGIAGSKHKVLLFEKGDIIDQINPDQAEKRLWEQVQKIIKSQ